MKKIAKQLIFIVTGLAVIASSILIIRATTGGGGEGVVCSQDPASCVNYGLVGYWDFEEGAGTTANDQSGNSNTGTLTNMVTGTPWTTGIQPFSAAKTGGSALSFDGVDDYVLTGNASALPQFSVEYWCKITSAIGSQAQCLVSKDRNDGSAVSDWVVGVNTSAYPFIGTWPGGYSEHSANSTISTDVWHYIAVTFDSSDVIRFYIDGVHDGTAAETGDLDTHSQPITIGSGAVGGIAQYRKGSIDDVRIYNRALSPEEIRYHYNRGGPVLHYKFDEGSGTTAHDEVGDVDAAFPAASANQPSWTSP